MGSCSPMKRVPPDQPATAVLGPNRHQAEVALQLIREYIYLYGAVSPKDGTCVYVIMPRSDTACFQVFLNALSQKFARQDILLVLDGAPNHRCSGLTLPGNISLLFLQPYSPELNPKENLWKEILEKILRITPLSQSTLCAPNSSRRSSTSNAIQKSSNPSPHSPTSESHSDVEMVLPFTS